MSFALSRWFARLIRDCNSGYCIRLERYMNWLRSPLAILVQAMIASNLCGLFLHPQGFLLAFGLGALMAVGVVWPWLSLRGLTGSLSFEKRRAREGETRQGLPCRSTTAAHGVVGGLPSTRGFITGRPGGCSIDRTPVYRVRAGGDRPRHPGISCPGVVANTLRIPLTSPAVFPLDCGWLVAS